MVGRRIIALVDRMSITTQGLAALGAFAAMLAVGTVGFHYLERDWYWIESFYF